MRYRKHVRLDSGLYHQGWFFVTFVTRFRQLLLGGVGREAVEEVFRDELRRFPGWLTDTLIVMPNHVHAILVADCHSQFVLFDVIGAIKSLSAKAVNRCLGRIGSVWQPNYYERIIRNENELNRIRDYIIANPEDAEYDWDRIIGSRPVVICNFDTTT